MCGILFGLIQETIFSFKSKIMKFNSLKLFRNGIAIIAACSFIACGNESGNNSTKAESEKAADSGTNNSTNQTAGVTVKKRGKVSADMNMKADVTVKMRKDEQGYYNYTEVLPAYNGGQDALESYIQTNIEYPQDAIDNNVEGTVNVQFAVDEEGNITNIRTIGNKIGYGLEEESVKVVNRMPKWIPGKVNGKVVKTWRVLPITYRLEG